MNRIYKVIWSKAKNCYVVASELAKSRTKSPKSSAISPAIVAGVLACVLSFGAIMPAYAGDATKVSQTNNNNIIGADVWQWLHDNGLINENTTVSDVNGYFVFGNNTTVTNSGVGVTEADGFIGIGNGISATPRTGRDGRYASYMLNGLTALPVISHSVAVGDGVTLREEETIGIGYKALSEGYKSISIGSGAISNYERNVTIGAGAHSHGHLATALGAEAKAYGYRTVAIGYDAQALPYEGSPAYGDAARSRAVAIGSGSRALANLSVAIGDNAIAEAGKAWVVSIGANSYSGLLGANANGYGARAFGKNSVAMGRQARAGEPKESITMDDATTYVKSKGDMNGFGAVAIGYMANAVANSSFAVGYKAHAHGVGSMAFGSGAPQTDTDFDNITQAWGKNSIAFGYNARALADNTVSLGAYTEATGQRSLVFGTSGTDAVASGVGLLDNSRVEGQGAIAIGDRAVVDSKILVKSNDPDTTVNDAIAVGTEAHTRARNGIAIGGNVSYTDSNGETLYGSHNGRDFGALVGEGADSAIAIGGASLDETNSELNSKLSESKLVVSYEAAASLGKRGVAIGSGALVSGGDAYARYESLINSDDYKNAKLAYETAETEYLNAQLQVSNKQTEIDSLDPSADDYETVKAQLEGELATLTTTAGEKLNALNAARLAWEEQEAAALLLQQGNAEADADAIAIGTNSRAGIKNSIAVGKDASTGDKAESSIAIGEEAKTGETALRSIAIGKGSVVNGADSIALGKSTVDGDKSIAIGYGHTVTGNNSGTFGDPNIINADNSYAVGNNSIIGKNISDAFVFGNNVTVNNGTLPANWDTLTDAEKSANTGYGVVALGNNVTVSLDEKAYKSRESGTAIINHVVAIGDNSVVGEENATAIGYGAQSKALNSLAIGTGATAQAENSISIGGSANTAEKNALAIGNASTALKEGSLSFGNSASSSEKNAMALGNNTYTKAEGGVALGHTSRANRSALVGTNVYGYDVATNSDRVRNDKTSSVWQSTLGAVSIGLTENDARENASGTRQLTGLAAGTADTDAVNVAQLKQAATRYYSVNADDSANPDGTNFLNDGAKAVGAMAVGRGAFGYGDHSVAVGYGATAGATDGKGFTGHYSVAIGNGASAVDLNSVAIGSGAVAEKENSVSIGSGSVATEVNSVSFGTAAVMSGETVVTPEVTRRLMHVTAGTDDTDAVNVKQLNDSLLNKANKDASNVGKSITLPDDYFTPGTTDEEKARATREARLLNQRAWGEALGGMLDTNDKTHIAAQDTRLVYGKDVHQYGTPGSNGNYIVVANTVGQNLTALDTALKASDDSSVKSITANGKVVTYTKGNGTTGTFTTQDTTYTAGHGLILTETEFKAKAGKNTTVDANGIHALDTKVEAGTGMAMETSGDTPDVNNVRTYKVGLSTETQNKLNNAMASFKTAVDGGTAQTISKTADTANFINGKNMEMTAGEAGITVATKENVTFTSVTAGTGDSAVAISGSGVQVGGSTYISSNGLNANGKVISNVASGSANTDAVNVSQLKELGDGKANVALDNITAAGHNVIKTDAKSAINVKGNMDVKVTKTDVNGVDTYNLSVAKDGTVVGGDMKLVTGDTVYNAIQGVISDTETALNGKANVNLDNINADGVNVVRTVAKNAVKVADGENTTVSSETDTDGNITYKVKTNATGTVTANNTGLVDGGTVYGETRPTENGYYIRTSNTAGENLSVLDTQIKISADRIDGNYRMIGQNRAEIRDLKDLSNITDAGKTVIKNLAKGSVNVVGIEDITVTKTDVNGVDTYKLVVSKDGRVATGDTGLITGKTAFEALMNETRPESGNYIKLEKSAGQNLNALDTQIKLNADAIKNLGDGSNKANITLDNITADGHNVIKADAKSAINVEGNMDVKVTKTDVNGVDTYSLSVAKDGTVVGGDMKLVTGDTVYNAIQGVISETETALKGKANVNLDNINADGVNVVRTVAKNAVKVADGENTTVSSETDTDGNITYKVKTNATGMVTVNNTGLLNGGTVYNEVRPESDGNYITVANTTGQNLTALDAKLKQTYELAIEASTQGHDANAVHYDSVSKEKVTLQGENGTVLTNLKDGEVSATSTDAVTGRQLHEVKQTTIENKQAIDGLTEKVGTTNDGSYVKSTNTVGQNLNTLDSQLKNNSDAISTLRETTNTQLETKTNTDMSNITETGKETIRELARGSVNVVSEDGTVTVTESNVDTVRTFDLSVVKDGKVESGNTGIVTGGTVYDAIQKSSMITLEDNTIRIGAKNNAEIIDITNSNGEGRVLHGIITDPNDNNSAANVGYVNAIGEAVINNVNGGFRRMDEKINKTGAHAAALASLAPASFDGGEKWALSAAVGNYHGETAAAIGAFYRPADNIMINLRSSLGSGNNMVGAGVSFALDKGFSTGISKKQLVNTINVQAEKLQQAEARIAEQDRRAAEQDKKIAELEAIVKELVKERKQ